MLETSATAISMSDKMSYSNLKLLRCFRRMHRMMRKDQAANHASFMGSGVSGSRSRQPTSLQIKKLSLWLGCSSTASDKSASAKSCCGMIVLDHFLQNGPTEVEMLGMRHIGSNNQVPGSHQSKGCPRLRSSMEAKQLSLYQIDGLPAKPRSMCRICSA